MSARSLDLPSIVGRIRAPAKGAEPSIESGAASKIEIPDPVTLLELAAQAGLTLEWVLYGGGEQAPGSAASAGSKRDHPPPVNLVLQQPAMVELRELLSGPTGAAGTHGRTETCERMLRALTNAERAMITTSNAASLLLIGGALASGRDIVVAARSARAFASATSSRLRARGSCRSARPIA